jgi:tRNA-specific 2-thiouridylase
MPIGQYTKNEVRDIASKANIPVVNKPDSQQICFVPDNNYRELLKEMGVATSNGPIKTIDGRSIGTHNGYQFYTIGQREGLGVSLGKPMYVVDIVPKENTIVIGEDSELLSDSALIENTNWLVEVPETFEAEVQIRHGSAPISAIITKINSQKYKIKFKSQARAVTPGQAAVCYNGDVMLGGGWLEKANITKKL